MEKMNSFIATEKKGRRPRNTSGHWPRGTTTRLYYASPTSHPEGQRLNLSPPLPTHTCRGRSHLNSRFLTFPLYVWCHLSVFVFKSAWNVSVHEASTAGDAVADLFGEDAEPQDVSGSMFADIDTGVEVCPERSQSEQKKNNVCAAHFTYSLRQTMFVPLIPLTRSLVNQWVKAMKRDERKKVIVFVVTPSFVSQRLAEGERIYEADNQFRAASSGPADAVVSPDDSMFGTVPKEPETNDLEYD